MLSETLVAPERAELSQPVLKPGSMPVATPATLSPPQEADEEEQKTLKQKNQELLRLQEDEEKLKRGDLSVLGSYRTGMRPPGLYSPRNQIANYLMTRKWP